MVEEIDQPTLRTTDGKVEDNGKDQQKKQHGNNAKKVHEKEQVRNVENPSSNPKGAGISVVANEGVTNPSTTRIRVEETTEA